MLNLLPENSTGQSQRATLLASGLIEVPGVRDGDLLPLRPLGIDPELEPDLNATTGVRNAMASALILLAGRGALTGPIIQSQLKSLACGLHPGEDDFSGDDDRRVEAWVRVAKTTLHEEKANILTLGGSVQHRSIYMPEADVLGNDIALSVAFAEFVDDIFHNTGLDWYKFTGEQSQGNQAVKLINVLDQLIASPQGEQVIIEDYTPDHSLQNAIQRLIGINIDFGRGMEPLVEMGQYNAGYQLRENIIEQMDVIKSNWEQLTNGQTSFMATDNPKYLAIIETFNEIGLENSEPFFEASSEEIWQRIPVEQREDLGITKNDINFFFRTLERGNRGTVATSGDRPDYNPHQDIVRRIRYTSCHKVIPVSKAQSQLRQAVDYTSLNGISVDDTLEIQESIPFKLLVLLELSKYEGTVSKETLSAVVARYHPGDEIEQQAWIKEMMADELDALESELTGTTFLKVNSPQGFKVLNKIRASVEQFYQRYYSLVGEEKGREEIKRLFVTNLLPFTNLVDKCGNGDDYLGLPEKREQLILMIVSYLGRMRLATE